MYSTLSTHPVGSWSELSGESNVCDLTPGLDFRLPKYRREVFLRFYEFHLKYKSHPGAVYFMFDYIKKEHNLSKEQLYWLAFINGVTQNIVTSWILFSEFPTHKSDPDKMQLYINDNWPRLGWDMDRRYVKANFGKSLSSYQSIVGGSQVEYFESVCSSSDVKLNFRNLWNIVINKFAYYGRLSTFSYLEYLKIVGVKIDCDSLFLDDMSGSKSHRNGLSIILGRDDMDWHDKINPKFMGYNERHIPWLEKEGEVLLEEAKERFKGKEFYTDVSYFTLESTMCCYKSWHRPNRRYPNVYMDMFHDRIKKAEEAWGDKKEFSMFWNARRETLSVELRLEDNPSDPGLSPEKQNHYLTTGEVIMMDKEYECFTNTFNKQSTLESFYA